MFGIENVFTFILNFFFCIWIGNESEDCVPAYLLIGLGRVRGGDRVLTRNVATSVEMIRIAKAM